LAQGLKAQAIAMASKRVPVLSRAEAVALLKRERPGYWAFYSSVLGGITTDPGLFVVPLDDHLVVRGHGVFDTCTLRNGRLYRLDEHLARFEKSMEIARLELPAGLRERLRDIILETAAAAGRPDGAVRYWAASGPGNFGVTGDGCVGSFYVAVYEDLFPSHSGGPEPIKEVTIPHTLVPAKQPPFSTVKSNNYMPNVLCMMAAKDKGGTFGIWLDEAGYVLESCVLGIVAVMADGEVVTPPTDNVLDSLTVKKIIEEAAKDNRYRVSRRPLKGTELYTAKEVLIGGGDCHIFPIKQLDGHVFTGGHDFCHFILDRINACALDPAQTVPLPAPVTKPRAAKKKPAAPKKKVTKPKAAKKVTKKVTKKPAAKKK